MESFLNRYRNITVLLLVIFAQLVLLAVQVKNEQDVRFIRVWTITAVSPFARLVEAMRGSSLSFVRNYITLHDTNEQNRKLQAEVNRLTIDNTFLTNQLNTADRAKALQLFQQKTRSKTLAASVIMVGIGSSRKVVYVDRGTASGVMREMAVIIPDGIVGKVTAVNPTSSEVLLVTDPMFAAGVVSGKTHAHGMLKGTGSPLCKIDFVAFEDKVEVGDWFYTSGDDRIFPRGLPVGVVKSVRAGQPYKQIELEPSGFSHGSLEDVLIVTEGAHEEVPDAPAPNQPLYMAPPVPAAPVPPGTTGSAAPGDTPGVMPPARPVGGTEADRTRSEYQKAADGAGIVGGGPDGKVRTDKPPDFTKMPVDPRSLGGARGGQPAAPAPAVSVPKKSTAPPVETKGTGPAESKTTPDAIRRANQAGGGPGGPPRL